MTKRSTRIQPTTTAAINASGRDLSDLDRQNLDFFQRHNAQLAAFAYHCFKEYGRGAVMVNLTSEAAQAAQPAPATRRLEEGIMTYAPRGDWTNATPGLTSSNIEGVISKIDRYDPNTGVVVVVMREPQGLAAYRIRTVPTPPDAYQQHSLELSLNEALSQPAQKRYLTNTGETSADETAAG
jgi:hypothetical protein